MLEDNTPAPMTVSASLPVQRPSAQDGAVPDWTEYITSKVWVEHLDNNWITIMHFADFKPETIDEWLDLSVDVMTAWPDGRPTFLCLDATKIRLSDIRYMAIQMSKQKGRRNDIDVYIVIWLERSLPTELLAAIGRTTFVMNGKTKRMIVNSRADVLRWLRYHLNQYKKKQGLIGT